MARLDAVTRLRREQVGEDRWREPIFDLVETELPGARYAPKDVIPAPTPDREPVVIEPTLYWLREWPDVVASDLLRVRGIVFEVQTDPAEWRGSTVGGLVVKLRDTREGVA